MRPLKQASDLNQQSIDWQPATVVPCLHCIPLNFPKKYHLSDLLPYDTNKRSGAGLRSGLRGYEMLITASMEAMHALALGDLKKFDPLVGENACEIRGVWTATIISNKLIRFDRIFKEIINIQDFIFRLLQPRALSQLMSSGISLMKLLKKENLLISLNLEEFFMIQSFLLTEAKTTIFDDTSFFSLCIKEKCDSKKIKRFGDISSSFADNLLSKLRKFIATASVKFTQDIAFSSQDPVLVKMVSDEFTVKHNTLPCTPMFWTYKAVLFEAQRARIPLILHVKFLKTQEGHYQISDEDYLLFEVNHNGGYVESDISQDVMDKAGWVVQGVVTTDREGYLPTREEWRENIRQIPIVDVILAGAADHRQYPDPAFDARIEALHNPEFSKYRSFARAHGFSSENPTTFFIQHVYASNTRDFLKSVAMEAKQFKEKVFLAPQQLTIG